MKISKTYNVRDGLKVCIKGKNFTARKCPFCGKELKTVSSFSSHIKRVHKISLAQYVFNYYKNITPDFEYQTCGFCERTAAPLMTIDYEKEEYSLSYSGYMCGTDECIDNICLEFFGEHHEQAKHKFEHIGAKTKFLVKKYKTTEEYVNENLKRDKDFVMPKSALTSLEGYILRYGEELGRKKYKERCNKIAYSVSIEWHIEKYGVEKGILKYEERMNKTIEATADIKHSKHQYEIFDELKKEDDNWEDERFAGGVGIVDMINKKKKIVIEYFGDYWHCNPLIYKDTYFHKNLRMTAKEKQNKDKIRLQKILKSKNVDMILVIWEKSFHAIGLDNVVKMLKEMMDNEENKGKVLWV